MCLLCVYVFMLVPRLDVALPNVHRFPCQPSPVTRRCPAGVAATWAGHNQRQDSAGYTGGVSRQ